LLPRLRLAVVKPISNPNGAGKPDTSVDCVVDLMDGAGYLDTTTIGPRLALARSLRMRREGKCGTMWARQ
jgi:hypothetical protein